MLFTIQMFSQGLYIEIPLKTQISNSDLIIEGKVLSKESYFGDNGNIFTKNKVEVYKVFKGSPNQIVDVITSGGVVGLKAETVSTSPPLNIGDIGIFMLTSNNSNVNLFGASQGFYKYELSNNQANNVITSKKDIDKFINTIISDTNQTYKRYNSFDSKTSLTTKSLDIVSFDLTHASAGTGTVLTISGTGFGATKGKVSFNYNAQSGISFVDAITSNIVSWSDTQIKVKVPYTAGTGPIRVTTLGGVTFDSTDILTIDWGVYCILSSGTNGNVDTPTQLYDTNNKGGYTFEMGPLVTELGKASFQIALDNWRCNTGVNWEVSPVNSNLDVVALDGKNVISFISSNTLNGVLSQTTSRHDGCYINGVVYWHIDEIDIAFNKDIKWFYGTGDEGYTWDLVNYSYDFETVALHELGHALQLTHVNDDSPMVLNGNDVMIYNLQIAEYQRVLGPNNIAGGLYNMNINTNAVICSKPLMTVNQIGCTLADEEFDVVKNGVNVIKNPIGNELSIKSVGVIIKSVSLYDINGRMIKRVNYKDSDNYRNIDVTSLSSGMYIINIDTDKGVYNKKVIKI